MSVTVSDCLKLTSLQESKVLAGHKGLNNIVTAVSVLEYADCSILADGFFIGNEIIITAFVSVKDDVQEQCRVIRRLAEGGEVGIILYYVGIFLPKVDQKIIDVANELNFPLICMPTDRFDFRYSDVISEIYEFIFKDQMEETYFVSGMLDRIAQLQEIQLTIDTVLRMLSDRLRCTLILCNRRYEYLGSASWPMASRWNYKNILEKVSQLLLHPNNNPRVTIINDVEVYLSKLSVVLENQFDVELIAIDETGRLKQSDFSQAAEVVQLFVSIWKYDFGNEGRDALVQAILRDEPTRMRYIAKLKNFDIASINVMWVLIETEKNLTSEDINCRNMRRIIMSKMFLQENRKLAFVDKYEDNVIIFMNKSSSPELDSSLDTEFVKLFNDKDSNLVMVTFQELETTIDAREAYLLIETTFSAAHLIYPKCNILGEHELKFAQNCLLIVDQGEKAINKIIDLLKPLRLDDDETDLIKTLSVFLLDGQKNMEQTGAQLFVHKNTVKYRINKIKQKLGYDIYKMPEAYALYMAVALNRLLNMQD